MQPEMSHSNFMIGMPISRYGVHTNTSTPDQEALRAFSFTKAGQISKSRGKLASIPFRNLVVRIALELM